MKKIIVLLACAALGFVSCKKDKNAPVPAPAAPIVNNPDPNTPVAGVDQVKLNITKVTTPVALHNVGGNSYMWFEMVNGRIYYGSPSNSGKNDQYFDSYSIADNKFTAMNTSKEICACGYMSAMVGDNNGSIIYIANEAQKFSISLNKWEPLNFPATAKTNHGESGAIFLNNKVYYIGGRTVSTLVKYYDIAANSWFTAADFPYATNMSDGVGVGNKLYVFGGTGHKSKFSIYDEATSTWTTKKDLPFEFSSSYGMHRVAAINDLVFVYASGNIHIYDIKADTWAKAPIAFTGKLSGSVSMFASSGKLYIVGANNSLDFQLYQATVNTN